jgi:RHS repeat-associated protein
MSRLIKGLMLAGLMLAGASQAQTVEYIHTDALGSVVAVTNAQRKVQERREYEPYGHQLTPTVANGPGYTGHVQDAATGLVYMQQRYYDAQIGRFLSVDPMGPLDDPITSFGRYHYAANNPYANIDPDGRRCVVANGDSVYCMRRDIYRAFDRGAAGSTRFFGAAAMTVEYLANRDIPGVRLAGSLGAGISPEANRFLDGVSSSLFSLNAKTYSRILNGSLSGAGLDAKLVNMEQTAVQSALDALPAEQRDRIIGSINSSFGARFLAGGHPADRAYNRVLDGVEKGLGRAIDFGKQSDREAIGNALIKDLRSSGACTSTGSRIKSC